ncbi:MAG TPA: hypothetical protein VME17_11900 [Bryobacteraceae bacterium]|nr:hypothetical protein [Bryobacteraceae bacterium]
MRPVEPQVPGVEESREAPERSRHWGHTLGVILFVIVCFEVGIFLLAFPWTDQWNGNSVANMFPWLRNYWSSSYFRGALSGLGVLNIYISMGELMRLRRPGPPPADPLPPADKLKASTL